MNQLAQRDCAPISGKEPRMTDLEIRQAMVDAPGWKVIEENGEKRLQRSFAFPDFAKALAFTDTIGQMAEAQNHHPSLLTEWGMVTITWWTHKVHGLHINDFIMAAKTNQAFTDA